MNRANPRVWKDIFNELENLGQEVSPRGQKVLELEDYQITFNPITDVFCPFPERNLPKKYFAGELAWYLAGNPNDTRIERYSSMWKEIANGPNEPNRWNSNYGYYLFSQGQFDYCYSQLVRDEHTRQACVVLNSPTVMMGNSKDKVCTNTVTFRIRKGKLNMTVHMRSNDAVYGLGYDAPTWGVIYEMMYVKLKAKYPELQVGEYVHQAVSFHIYERHFEMMKKINSRSLDENRVFHLPLLETVDQVNELFTLLPKVEEKAHLLKAASNGCKVKVTGNPIVAELVRWLQEEK